MKFLNERHGKNYWVFNCSERTYDKTPFENRGSDFLWKDHHAPTLPLLFAMVKAMFDYLKGNVLQCIIFIYIEDKENRVVVHCNSGKGRTGTAIACLLLYSAFTENMDDALKYYGWKRFSTGKGVT